MSKKPFFGDFAWTTWVVTILTVVFVGYSVLSAWTSLPKLGLISIATFFVCYWTMHIWDDIKRSKQRWVRGEKLEDEVVRWRREVQQLKAALAFMERENSSASPDQRIKPTPPSTRVIREGQIPRR